ncbi:zinc-binding dehydrogenase [Rhodococcus sp. OK302]|uniref:zinc-binding dehydrogenase n=1 Tax=Rhodococcus sp. OK302 TaxID=1882769 RepID=UPI0020CEDACF|nr:zinc-binding dehydrogenase [Rhodococcus sp. OK302]
MRLRPITTQQFGIHVCFRRPNLTVINPLRDRKTGRVQCCIDATAGDTVAAVRELTDGGANHVFDCVGGEAITSQAMDMLDWGEQLIMLGVAGPDAKLSVPAATFYMDRSVLGCRYGSSRPGADIPKYLDLYRSGRIVTLGF